MAGGLVLFCCAPEVVVNGLILGAFNLFRIWELVIFTIFDGASSPNPEPRTDDCKDMEREKTLSFLSLQGCKHGGLQK